MALLSELFVAAPGEAQKYDEDPRAFAPHRAEFRDLTYEEFANLWAALRGMEPDASDSDAFEQLLVVEEGQRLVHRFPDDMVARLADLPDQDRMAVAGRWVQTGELAFLECPPEDVESVLEALQRLARTARSEGKLLCLWMSA